ncbi:MAG: FAD-binding oxidoreductase [Hyphomicrobiaceae bacterium]
MFTTDAFWWEAAPPQALPERPVPANADVVIIGAGYTGLSAAITLARAGRSVVAFDRMKPGEGASSRNGGIASGNLRPGFAELTRRFGEARALAIQAESKTAREDLADFIRREGIDCDFVQSGRFTGASSAKEYEQLAREAERLRDQLGIEAHAVPASEQRRELGTDFYHGGLVRMDIGGLHPAKLHAEMLRVALAAGAEVHGETPVRSLTPGGRGFRLETSRGPIEASQVIVATNGYTDGVDPWLRRRLVPVMSRIIATEPISDNLMRQLMPAGRMCSETRKLHYYFRPSPDGRRILWGGRDGALQPDPQGATLRLERAMHDVFPELRGTAITHSWFGYVAMHLDMVPRLFTHEGLHYACGYCGSGVVWARWAGLHAARQVLGEKEVRSAFDFRPPSAIPLYRGRPWFMPAVFKWFELQDRLSQRLRKRTSP